MKDYEVKVREKIGQDFSFLEFIDDKYETVVLGVPLIALQTLPNEARSASNQARSCRR